MSFRVKLLDRYIIREVLGPFFVGMVGFVVILITDILFTLTDMIINKGVPASAVIKLLVFKLPAMLVLTFPVSTLFGTAMALGRLSEDSEIIAMRTSGISLFRIALPILVLSLFISMAAFSNSEFLVPWCNQVSENIIRQVIMKQPVTQVRENVFFKDKGNRYFYVKRVDQSTQTLYDVMVYEFEGEKLPRVIVARQAKYDGGKWLLEDGTVHDFGDDGLLAYEAKFDKMSIDVSENFLGYSDQKTTQEMSSRELMALIVMLKRGGVNTNSLLVDLYMKFSVPLTCFVFALLGIPLSIPGVRATRSLGVIMCITVVFLFYVFASTSRSFGYGGIVPPIAAAFVPQLTFSLLGGSLLFREAIKR